MKVKTVILLLFILLFLRVLHQLSLSSGGGQNGQRDRQTSIRLDIMGFEKEVLKEGSGPKPRPGQSVTVHCTGFEVPPSRYCNAANGSWQDTEYYQDPTSFVGLLGRGVYCDCCSGLAGKELLGQNLTMTTSFSHLHFGLPYYDWKRQGPFEEILEDKCKEPVKSECQFVVLKSCCEEGTLCTKDPGQQPFEFIIGKKKVIAGWDEGVLGMNLGEVARLKCSPDYAYGASGFPAWGIQPNSVLVFEIEVLEIK